MKRIFIIPLCFLLAITAAAQNKYYGTFSGNGSALTGITAGQVGAQPASGALTTLANGDGGALTNLQNFTNASALWIDPNGKDTWPGTREKPMKTVDAAVSALPAGWVLVVNPGAYNFTNAIVKKSILGIGNPTLTNCVAYSGGLGAIGCVPPDFPGKVQGVTFVAGTPYTIQPLIGSVGSQPGFTNAWVEDVVCLGDSDGFYPNITKPCSATLVNTKFLAKWDAGFVGGQNTHQFTYRDCTFSVAWPSVSAVNSNVFECNAIKVANGTNIFINCYFEAVNGPTNTRAFYSTLQNGNGRTELNNCTWRAVSTNGTVVKLLHTGNSPIYVNGGNLTASEINITGPILSAPDFAQIQTFENPLNSKAMVFSQTDDGSFSFSTWTNSFPTDGGVRIGSTLPANTSVGGDGWALVDNGLTIGNSGPTLTAGSSSPTSSQPDGSLYFRTTGQPYVRTNGAWQAFPGITGGSGGGASLSNTIPAIVSMGVTNVWCNAGAASFFDVTVTNNFIFNLTNSASPAFTNGEPRTVHIRRDGNGTWQGYTTNSNLRFMSGVVTGISFGSASNADCYLSARWDSVSNRWDIVGCAY